jgi:hypothetical protein
MVSSNVLCSCIYEKPKDAFRGNVIYVNGIKARLSRKTREEIYQLRAHVTHG